MESFGYLLWTCLCGVVAVLGVVVAIGIAVAVTDIGRTRRH